MPNRKASGDYQSGGHFAVPIYCQCFLCLDEHFVNHRFGNHSALDQFVVGFDRQNLVEGVNDMWGLPAVLVDSRAELHLGFDEGLERDFYIVRITLILVLGNVVFSRFEGCNFCKFIELRFQSRLHLSSEAYQSTGRIISCAHHFDCLRKLLLSEKLLVVHCVTVLALRMIVLQGYLQGFPRKVILAVETEVDGDSDHFFRRFHSRI